MERATKIFRISLFLLMAGLSLPAFSTVVDPHEMEIEDSESAFELQECRYYSRPFIVLKNGELNISMCNLKEEKVKFVLRDENGKKIVSFKSRSKKISKTYLLEGFEAEELKVEVITRERDFLYAIKVS